jgi:RNA polymerase sigma factor (sigma-70 family)
MPRYYPCNFGRLELMDTTSPTLLERLRGNEDSQAWREFAAIYSPLMQRFARLRGFSIGDAEDVAQECMTKLSRTMPSFQYDSKRGSFKGMLFTMVNRCIIQRARKRRPSHASTSVLNAAAARSDPGEDAWDREWLRHHLQYCLRLVEAELAESTVAAFRLYALKEWPVEKVCQTLGLTANQVYLAKSRVMRRLREELEKRIGDVLRQ